MSARLVVDVLRGGHVRRRQRVAAVGLVRLGHRREQVLPIDEDGDQDGVVGRVRVAEVGVVVQERVALGEIVVELRHGLREVLRAHDVHGQALGGGEQLVVGGDDGAGEVARLVDDGGARGAQERVRHLAADAVEPVGDHRQPDRVERALLDSAHCVASGRFELPGARSRSSR